MSAAKITSSQRKLDNWAAVRALDKLAAPMLRDLGVAEAYRVAIAIPPLPSVQSVAMVRPRVPALTDLGNRL
jgi:hypothetical protein